MNEGGSGGRHAARISMTLKDVVTFSLTAGLAAVFLDAALVHGLFRADDPAWTYWVIKPFLVSGVLLVGTALRGVSLDRAREFSAVSALVVAAYLQWLSPVGMPQEPRWLDAEGIWLVGVPLDFLATLGGYLVALWLWRHNRAGGEDPVVPHRGGTILHALFLATLIVVLDASLGQLVFRRDFPGLTLLTQHFAIAFVFLCLWLTYAGDRGAARLAGGVMLALLWLTFDLYLGLEGLPSGNPVRPAFGEVWWPSFPISVIAALLGLGASGRMIPARRGLALGGLALAMLFGATWKDSADAEAVVAPKPFLGGLPGSAEASGDGYLIAGMDPSNPERRYPITGTVEVSVVDAGNPDPETPNTDRLDIRAHFRSGEDVYDVAIRTPMARHPFDHHTTWSGVAYDREIHGETGIGSGDLPKVRPEIAVWGWADVTRNGEVIARMAPAHLMVCTSGAMPGIMLQVDTEGRGLLTEPEGYLMARWPTVAALSLPERRLRARHLAGCAALLVIVVAFALLAKFDAPVRVETG